MRQIKAPYKVQAREAAAYHEPLQTRWIEQIQQMGDLYKTPDIYTRVDFQPLTLIKWLPKQASMSSREALSQRQARSSSPVRRGPNLSFCGSRLV